MSEKEKIVRVGIGCWVENPTGHFLFGRRLAVHGNGAWAPPGGHLNFGEMPRACAVRELYEETGIRLMPNDFHVIGFTNDVFNDRHYVTIHCHAKLNYWVQPKEMEPDKCSAWYWLNLSFLPDNLFLPARNLLKQKVFGV